MSQGCPQTKKFPNFAVPETGIMTHGVIGNTSDFGSAESWFEPRWVNKRARVRAGAGISLFCSGSHTHTHTFPGSCQSGRKPGWVNKKARVRAGADTSLFCSGSNTHTHTFPDLMLLLILPISRRIAQQTKIIHHFSLIHQDHLKGWLNLNRN